MGVANFAYIDTEFEGRKAILRVTPLGVGPQPTKAGFFAPQISVGSWLAVSVEGGWPWPKGTWQPSGNLFALFSHTNDYPIFSLMHFDIEFLDVAGDHSLVPQDGWIGPPDPKHPQIRRGTWKVVKLEGSLREELRSKVKAIAEQMDELCKEVAISTAAAIDQTGFVSLGQSFYEASKGDIWATILALIGAIPAIGTLAKAPRALALARELKAEEEFLQGAGKVLEEAALTEKPVDEARLLEPEIQAATVATKDVRASGEVRSVSAGNTVDRQAVRTMDGTARKTHPQPGLSSDPPPSPSLVPAGNHPPTQSSSAANQPPVVRQTTTANANGYPQVQVTSPTQAAGAERPPIQASGTGHTGDSVSSGGTGGASTSHDFALADSETPPRKIHWKSSATNPNWGLTRQHLNKHLFGNDLTSLKQIDPGGTPDQWSQDLTSLSSAPVTSTTSNGMLDIVQDFPRADGSGTFKLGIRLAPRSDGTYDLITILTRQ